MDKKTTVINLDEIKTVEALKRENKAAILTIEKLLKELSESKEKIKHLESMVRNVVPVTTSVVKTEITPEEHIAELQLERLRGAAEMRSLTLEEARMYDILVKNKRLAQDQSTINLSKDNYKTFSSTDLLEIAGKVDDGDQS